MAGKGANGRTVAEKQVQREKFKNALADRKGA
jgi:hypothetical protein